MPRTAPGTMRCLHLTGFRQSLLQASKPMPEPTGSQVLPKVLACGVCHSDLHVQDGQLDIGHGQVASFEGRCTFPLTLGHETSGQMVALGPDAAADAAGVKVGDSCLVCGWIGCGSCSFCRQGDEHLCADSRFLGVARDGGFADHIVVPHPRYLVDLAGIDPVSAAPQLRAAIAGWAHDDLCTQLQAERIAFGPVVALHDVLQHPQMVARQMTVTAQAPGGAQTFVRQPLLFDGVAPTTVGPVPALGQHNADLLGPPHPAALQPGPQPDCAPV